MQALVRPGQRVGAGAPSVLRRADDSTQRGTGDARLLHIAYISDNGRSKLVVNACYAVLTLWQLSAMMALAPLGHHRTVALAEISPCLHLSAL